MMRKSLNTGEEETNGCEIASDNMYTIFLTNENIECLELGRLYYVLKDF